MSDEIKNDEYIHGKVEEVDLDTRMKDYYLDYSMSVIVGRALPDVRDGLKPVHRRILYSMTELGLEPEKPYHKSANVVGTTMAWYHPHGDSSIYDAMVKLAQNFYMRYPLVDGRGNYGTMDGDPPAAYRYTEARMSKLAKEMLRDMEKDTVDFVPNFDEKKQEPSVLPARFPNLIVNGSSGIAVGMATSIPPHNLGETIDAIIEMIDNEYATEDDVLAHIQGPDFPTGAIIAGKKAIYDAYKKGRGKVTVKAEAEIVELKNGKSEIVFTSIPYQTNKASIVEKIADLVKEKEIEGISDLRDESNKKKGVNIVVEIKRDYNPEVILNQLYKKTPLQSIFSIILLSIVKGRPQILPLKKMLDCYLEHQVNVVTRRTEFDLEKTQDRLHLVEGYLIAIEDIDEVINVIRTSYDDAKEKLMAKYDFSDRQADAILDMRLKRLQGLEKEKFVEEKKELEEKITYFTSLLQDKKKLLGVIKDELLEIKDKYNNERRTKIEEETAEINILDVIPDEEVAITLTHQGYIKRLPADTYKQQKRGGKGIAGMTTKEEDFAKNLILTTNHEKIIYLTNIGKIYIYPVYEVPQSSRTAKGTNIINVLPIEKDEFVTSVIATNKDVDNKYLVMCTKNGIIKRTKISEFTKSSRQGIIAIKLSDEDTLINALLTQGSQEFILTTKFGKSIRFSENDVRSMGRTAMGVIAMRMDKGDEVISIELANDSKELLVISENGFGKRTPLSEYKLQNRGGKGLISYKSSKKTGDVAGALVVEEDDEVMMVTTDGTMIRISVKDISQSSRSTMGVKLMKLSDEDHISAVARIEAD